MGYFASNFTDLQSGILAKYLFLCAGVRIYTKKRSHTCFTNTSCPTPALICSEMVHKTNYSRSRQRLSPNQPLVSVIIPVHNAAKFIESAIRSVQRQSYKQWELIIVNDASSDATATIVRKIRRHDSRIRFVQLPRKRGVSSAMNLGIRRSRGTFIARLDADDTMHRYRIHKQVAFLQTHPMHIAVGGQCLWKDMQGKPLHSRFYPLEHEEIVKHLATDVPIRQPSLMVQKSKLPKGFRWYNTSLTIGEDIDFYYRLLTYGQLANLPDIVVTIRDHSERLRYDAKRTVAKTNLKTRITMKVRHGHDIPLTSILSELMKSWVRLVPSIRIKQRTAMR